MTVDDTPRKAFPVGVIAAAFALIAVVFMIVALREDGDASTTDTDPNDDVGATASATNRGEREGGLSRGVRPGTTKRDEPKPRIDDENEPRGDAPQKLSVDERRARHDALRAAAVAEGRVRPEPKIPRRETPAGAVLSKEAVMAGIKAVKPGIIECYESALPKDPSLAGRVVVRFEIESVDKKGRVVSGEIQDEETMSPFFEACVLEKVAGADFDAPEGDGRVVVSYPFLFDPGGGYGGAPSNDEAGATDPSSTTP